MPHVHTKYVWAPSEEKWDVTTTKMNTPIPNNVIPINNMTWGNIKKGPNIWKCGMKRWPALHVMWCEHHKLRHRRANQHKNIIFYVKLTHIITHVTSIHTILNMCMHIWEVSIVDVYESQCLNLSSWNSTLTNPLSMWATIFLEFLNWVFVRDCRIVEEFKGGGEGVNNFLT